MNSIELKKRALELREQGMTYKQIAETLGYSASYIYQLCGCGSHYHFRCITESGCIYPGLRAWMNENMVSRAELVRRMYKTPYPNMVKSMSAYMRGDYEPSKAVIDDILRITGLTYEQCFGGV